MSGNFDWLWKDDAPVKKTELSEGIEFSPGFTGLWRCAPMWRVWDSSGLDIEELGLKADAVQQFSTGSFYYYTDEHYEHGLKLCQAVGLKFGPKQVWRWEMNVDDAIGMTDKGKLAFGPIMGMDVGISAYSGRDRAELHMIALPSAVQAVAVAGGAMGQAFDYKTLLKDDIEELDDDWQHEMIGDDDTWTESKLWQARKSIWAALGEENPRAYMYNTGSKKYDTTSQMLGQVLRLLYDSDGTELYARVMRVPHPDVSAVTKEGKRLGVLCIDRVYKNQEEAEIADGFGIEDAVNNANNNYPPLPQQWVGANPDDWIVWVRDLLAEEKVLDKSSKVIENTIRKMDSRLQEEFACTADEVIPWIPIVKE